jgi:ABC-type phosphate/phosphonate transport system substrate-binding protein
MSSFRSHTVLFLMGLTGLSAMGTAHADLVLSAPPRESREAGEKLYGPLATYLSKVTGQTVRYEYPVNWGLYQAMMTRGSYDLVLDGPHFVSWRMQHGQHVPVAALDGNLSFVAISLNSDSHVHKLADLAGKPVCAHAPPNLATLTLLDQFPNQARTPRVVEVKGFKAAYEGLVNRKCAGTIVPSEMLKKFDGEAHAAHVLFESTALPNQALTAGPKVTAALRDRITKALVAPEGQVATREIAVGLGAQQFIEADAGSYKGLDSMLRNFWGFDVAGR